MGPRARIVNGWCVAATIAIGQCMAMWSSFNLSCMGGQRRGGLQKWCWNFLSMKNIYYENLSEKRIKARRGTTAIIISTGWCFGEKLFPSSWQTRHPNPNKDPYCLTPFSLKHLGIFVTKSWFLHSGPLPVINGVRTRLLTPVAHFKSPFIEVISPFILVVGAHLVKRVYYQTSFKEYCGESAAFCFCESEFLGMVVEIRWTSNGVLLKLSKVYN